MSSTRLLPVPTDEFQARAASGSASARALSATHDVVLFVTITYVVLTGSLITLLAGVVNGTGFEASGQFTLFCLASLLRDVVLIAPLFLFRRSRFGLLHPVILVVTIWPIFIDLPYFTTNFAGLFQLLFGAPVPAPQFVGSELVEVGTRFLAMAELAALEALGMAMLIFVYRLFARTLDERHSTEAPKTPYDQQKLAVLLMGTILFAALCVGVFILFRGGLDAHIATLSEGRHVALGGLGPFVVISQLGLVALFTWVMSNPLVVRTPQFLAGMMLAGLMAFAISGSRGAFLLAIVGSALCWAVRSNRFPVRLAALLAPVMLFLVGGLLIIRVSGGADSRVGLGVADRIAMTQVSDAYEAASWELDQRSELHGAAPVILEGYRASNGPLLGQTYVAALTWFVPRAIWPEKPRGSGSLYAQLFLGAEREGKTVPIGAVADAYWNFWIPGVLLIFGIQGYLVFLAQKLYLRFGADPFFGALYVIFITRFEMTAERMVPFFHMALLVLLLRWAALLIIARRGTVAAAARTVG